MTHPQDTSEGPNPSGLCMCGCGRKTTLAAANDRKRGNVKGQPTRFIRGHSSDNCALLGGKGPNPGGLCLCGCGQPTMLAEFSRKATGDVKGHPRKFLLGHTAHRPAGADYEVDGATGCWNWVGALDRYGYGRKAKTSAHRWYYRKFIGEIPNGLTIDHLCRNRQCVNPDHLEAVSMRENLRRGSLTRLTWEDAEAIRLLASEGKQYDVIARRFGVKKATVSSIVNRRLWKEP